MNGTGRLRRAAFALVTFVASCPPALALDPSLDVSQYAHTAWKVRDGFTKGAIFAIAQTPDGYLWLGTESGLVRFDGVRAVPWQFPADEKLPSNFVNVLTVSRDGTLWIGTHSGLASWKDNKLTRYSELAGLGVGAVLEDRAGTVWIGAYGSTTGDLCAVRGGKLQCYAPRGFGHSVAGLYQDHKSNLWVATETGLWRWAPDTSEHYVLPRGSPESSIEDDAGVLLLATTDGLERLVGGRIQSYALAGVSGQFMPTRFLRSSDGSLWIGSWQGLLHFHHGRTDVFKAIDGLSADFVVAIFEDREGNVWVGTQDGLDRFRDVAVPTISRKQGLSNPGSWSVQATPDGSIWIATADGLNRWASDHVTLYRSLKALRQNGQKEEHELAVSGVATEIANSGLAGNPQSLGEDERGRLWASTSEGVFYFEKDRFVRVPGVPGGFTNSIVCDVDGNIWISNGSREGGLFQVTRELVIKRIPWSLFGHSYAVALLPDPLRSGLWLGFADGGVAYFNDGQVRASYARRDGLGKGMVSGLRFDSRGGIWAATEGGLTHIKDGHIATLTTKNGLPCDSVHWLMEDDDDALWLYKPCGLVRIAGSEVDAWLNDPTQVVQFTTLGIVDGVRTEEIPGGYPPMVTKSPNGRIWFLARDGVSIIDPHHLTLNKLPPAVHIEQLTADDKTYPVSNDMHLPALVRNLDIDYTALSLVVPEKVHFRVKLEGQDKDWRELVNDRRVHYTNLAPHHYLFRVTACNNSGVWNEQGASLDFVIPPAWYQTSWFRGLCVAAFLALLWAAYRLRVGQLEAQEKKFREAVETMPALAFIARPDGYRTFVNWGWVEYTGLTVEQASGSGWQAAIHPDDLKRVIAKWRTSVATGEPLEYEMRLRRGTDGAYRWFQARATALRDKRGKVVKWCGVLTDIEDRKHAEQLQADLAHTNRVSMLGELAASISHELKQPIAATITNARTNIRWLKREQPDLNEAVQAAERIEKDGARATEIIDRLRLLYKKTPPQRELVDVNEIIGGMALMLRGEAHRFGVSIRAEPGADLPKITADRVQLQQVLMNLMLNGIEAMNDTGGVLTVKSELQDGQVVISVSDTGVGLPVGSADRIFDAFFTTKAQGSGMGLAISRSIVESHGGRLWATPNDGRGASFHFSLPIAVHAEETPAAGA